MDELQAQNQDVFTSGRILLPEGKRRSTAGVRHPTGKAYVGKGEREQKQSQAKRNMPIVLGCRKKGVPAIQDMEHH